MKKRVRMSASKPAQKKHLDLPMQYGASRISGQFAGGYFWNPPANCSGRVVLYFDERWVSVCLCRYQCNRYQKCEASKVKTKLSKEELDIPQNRPKEKTRVRVRRG